MSEHPTTTLTCGECSNLVQEDAEYCPNCGAMFKQEFRCTHHPSKPADGICVICKKPFCGECGVDVMNIYFCNQHGNYEVHEGMAQVFVHTDNVQVQHAARCLQKAGYHPFLFSRLFSPGSDIDHGIPFRKHSRNSNTDLKVLVPFCEVLEAEKALGNLSLFSL
jgi:hypothetical protein